MVMVLLPALECFKESIKHVETGRPLAGLQKHPLQARPAGKRGLGEAGRLRPWGKRRRHGGKRVIGSQAACPAWVILFISHPCEVGHEDVFSSDCSGQGRELVFVAESERHRHVTAVSKRAV